MRELEPACGEGARALSVRQEKLAGIYEPRHLPTVPDLEAAILPALDKTTGGNDLSAPAPFEKTVAIPVDDLTRAVPTTSLREIFLSCLEPLGFNLDRVTVICAPGAHRALTEQELLWADMFLYSSMDARLIEKYHMHPLREVGQIEAIAAESESIVIVPQATTTLPVLAGASA